MTRMHAGTFHIWHSLKEDTSSYDITERQPDADQNASSDHDIHTPELNPGSPRGMKTFPEDTKILPLLPVSDPEASTHFIVILEVCLL